MAKILLRSGSLDDFQTVGENGQSVFDLALQIRETLRLRKQQSLIDTLAIPQINDNGDRVDWYAPFPGKVSGWAAADAQTREQAMLTLKNTITAADALSLQCMRSDKAAQVRFGALLAKALQFPGSNHVYLVDGKPVITFWGFVNLNEDIADDVLACLVMDEPEPIPEPEPEIQLIPEELTPAPQTLNEPDAPLLARSPVSRPVAQAEEPLVYSPLPPASAQVTKPEPTPQKKRLPRWLLPVAPLVVAAVAAPVVWLALYTEQPAARLAAVTPEPTIAPAPLKEVPVLTASLPLMVAQVTPSPVPEAEPEPVTETITPPAKDALVMHADQVRDGLTTFLNGNWRVNVDFKDPVSGKIPSMRYTIDRNKGNASVTLRGKITCKVDVFSGLHSDGTLMIKTKGSARCSDGARYNMPQIACKATANDAAQCTGQYNDTVVVPVTFKKVSA